MILILVADLKNSLQTKMKGSLNQIKILDLMTMAEIRIIMLTTLSLASVMSSLNQKKRKNLLQTTEEIT